MIESKVTKPPAFQLWPFVRYVFASFFLLHLFGVFGIFYALSYPLWWFFDPKHTVCFYCLHISALHGGGHCPVCDRKITSPVNPPLKSVLVNMITILVVSSFALLIVGLEFTFVTMRSSVVATLAGKKAEFIIPERDSYRIEEDIPFTITISNTAVPANVIQADLTFDKEVLEVTKIDVQNSVATIIVQKEFSNGEGWVRTVGGTANPGFVGEGGTFATVFFKAKKKGIAEIRFLNTSKIIAADGKGTNLITDFKSKKLVIQ